MKKLKSHDDLKELRVGDLTTWHLAVDTSDVMSGPLLHCGVYNTMI